MAVKSSKVGAILGLIGSTILLIGGLAYLSISRVAYYPVPYIPPFLPYITSTITITLSVFGLTGSLLVFRDLRWGYIFLLIAGIAGIIGTLIPIYIYDTGYGYLYMAYAVSSLLYSDLVLMVIGGILGFALAEKKERA